jgi:hypothetical protein
MQGHKVAFVVAALLLMCGFVWATFPDAISLVIKDYQTLLAGILALSGAFLAYFSVSDQINYQREEAKRRAEEDLRERRENFLAIMSLLEADVERLVEELDEQKYLVEQMVDEENISESGAEYYISLSKAAAGQSLFLDWKSGIYPERIDIFKRIELARESLNDFRDTVNFIAKVKSRKIDSNLSEEHEELKKYMESRFTVTRQKIVALLQDLKKLHHTEPRIEMSRG